MINNNNCATGNLLRIIKGKIRVNKKLFQGVEELVN